MITWQVLKGIMFLYQTGLMSQVLKVTDKSVVQTLLKEDMEVDKHSKGLPYFLFLYQTLKSSPDILDDQDSINVSGIKKAIDERRGHDSEKIGCVGSLPLLKHFAGIKWNLMPAKSLATLCFVPYTDIVMTYCTLCRALPWKLVSLVAEGRRLGRGCSSKPSLV